MASPKGIDQNPEASDLTFPAVDVDRELNPGTTKNFTVDPVSSQAVTSKELKEQAKADEKEKKKGKKKKDEAQILKPGIIISVVVVAVIGAIFAISKKLRET